MKSSRVVLKAILERCPPGERSSLVQLLTPLERQTLEKLPRTYGNPLEDVSTDDDILRLIHPSWISPFLRNLSEKEIGFFLGSLTASQAHLVSKELLFTGKLPHLSPQGKTFLQKTLLRYLTAEVEDLLPLSCLPESPLNVLLDLSSENLNQSLDYFGLHDLSVEMRQIIEKKKLNKLYEALTSHQLNYLKILLQSSEPVVFAKMGLGNWNEDKEKLKLLIRHRGANRLAKALYGQDPSFIWYVLHKLDFENAFLVKKLTAPLENSRAVNILISQILEFITYTGKHHE